MPGTKSEPQAIRARPRTLNTQADLEDDQESFLRSNLEPQSAEAAIAALSFGRSKTSTTADSLQPITERKVAPRRRKPRPSSVTNAAFPPLEKANLHVPSRFARGHRPSTSNPPDFETNREIAREDHGDLSSSTQIDNMTPAQIREAQEEIAALLSPENIEFLRERGRARSGSMSAVKAREENSGSQSEGDKKAQDINATDTAGQVETSISPGAVKEHKEVANNEEEVQKRLWMLDADVDVPSQHELDQMLSESIRQLGALGDRRFNLSGKLLTPSEVESLPTHLGLHHHGSSPASAGYTLAEVLLLTRSTVAAQRVLSFRMLADILSSHYDEVIDALVRSGGLGSAFASFPAESVRDMGKTGQQAYVMAVEAVISKFSNIGSHDLVPGFYFGSQFYSPTLRESGHAVFNALSTTGCLPTLARILKLSATRDGSNGVVRRCLALIRLLIQNSTEASGVVLGDTLTLRTLMDMAIGLDFAEPWTSLLACDSLALAIPKIASRSSEDLNKLKTTVLSLDYLQKLVVHLSWFMQDERGRANEMQLEAAMGVMRLLRSALAFEEGTSSFTSVAQGICSLTQESPKISTEAFLALEAYAHSLFVRIRTSSEKEQQGVSMNVDPATINDEREGGDLFVKDQLSELVPVALSAANTFTSSSEDITDRARAACGHFAATLLALTTIQVDESVVVRVLNQCSASCEAIQLYHVEDFEQLQRLHALSSICHAGARLLSRIKLDGIFAWRVVTCLMNGVLAESRFLAQYEEETGKVYPWRCVANACAEWFGTLLKSDCSLKSVELTLELLPYLLDPQVILDLLSRCLVKVEVLQKLDSRLSVEEARKCATNVLSISLPDLSTYVISVMEGSQDLKIADGLNEADTGMKGLSMCGMIALWMKHDDIGESALRIADVYFTNGLLPTQELVWSVLCSPSSLHERSEHLFEYMYRFARGCVKEGKSLFPEREKTTLNVSSTSHNPVFAESLLALADSLVARGPTSKYFIDGKDPLSSTVFTFLCSTSVDASLRQSLWRKTVEECGGGGLYHYAHDLQDDCVSSPLADTFRKEEDAIIMEYCSVIMSGFLTGERCPESLGNVILSILAYKLIRKEEVGLLKGLRDSLLNGDDRSWSSLQTMVDVSGGSRAGQVVSTWMKSMR